MSVIAKTTNLNNFKYHYSKKDWLLIFLIGFSLFPAAIFSITFFGFQLSVFRALVAYLSIFLILPNIKWKQNYYCAFMIVWFLYGILTITVVDDYRAWGREIFFLFIACSTTLICSYTLYSQRVFLSACRFFALLLFLHNIIGYYEMETRNYLWIQDKSYAYFLNAVQAIPVSTFYNPNDFATALLFGLAITAICIKYARNRIERFCGIALFISSAFLIVRTLSRANLLGAIVGIFVFILIQKFDSQKLIASLFLLVTIGILLLFGPLAVIVNNFINQFLDFNMTYGSESQRLNLLLYGWNAFIKTMGVGTGAGNLANSIIRETGLFAGSIHFWWLEVLYTYGVLIWVGYITCYVNLVYQCIINSKNGSFISCVFGSFLLAYTIGACSSSSGMGNETLWCAWAIIIAYEKNIACTLSEKFIY